MKSDPLKNVFFEFLTPSEQLMSAHSIFVNADYSTLDTYIQTFLDEIEKTGVIYPKCVASMVSNIDKRGCIINTLLVDDKIYINSQSKKRVEAGISHLVHKGFIFTSFAGIKSKKLFPYKYFKSFILLNYYSPPILPITLN